MEPVPLPAVRACEKEEGGVEETVWGEVAGLGRHSGAVWEPYAVETPGISEGDLSGDS